MLRVDICTYIDMYMYVYKDTQFILHMYTTLEVYVLFYTHVYD